MNTPYHHHIRVLTLGRQHNRLLTVNTLPSFPRLAKESNRISGPGAYAFGNLTVQEFPIDLVVAFLQGAFQIL